MTNKDLEYFNTVVDSYFANDESVRATAMQMQLSRTKVRKILITMGVISSEITEVAIELQKQGKKLEDIADILNMSIATLSTYIPYGERVHNRAEKTKNAIRVENCIARQVAASDNQVHHSEENVTGRGVINKSSERVHMTNKNTALRLKLELAGSARSEETFVLKKYGKVNKSISREFIVPANMTLHALHYAIQKAFGWQNSHLHHFAYPESVFDELTNGKFAQWVNLCGLYFRFPDPEENDIFWDDDYEEGISFKTWLRRKYMPPYRYGGMSEHYVMSRLCAVSLPETLEVPPTFGEFLAGKKKPRKVNQKKATIEQMTNYFECSLDELLERLTIGEVIGVSAGKISSLAEDRAACFGKHMPEIDTALDLMADLNFGIDKDLPPSTLRRLDKQIGKIMQPIFDELEAPVVPLSNRLVYRYDYGDGWEVNIKCLKIIEDPDITVPVCVAADGLPVLDDVGGLYGYCQFLLGIHNEPNNGPYEDSIESREWARMLGWTGRMSKADNIL